MAGSDTAAPPATPAGAPPNAPARLDPIRPTDDAARLQAKALIRMARSGALATLDPSGHPFASLTSLATDMEGDPLILVSQLSTHTANMGRDRRVSLLVSAAGKGDPLAHPRLTIQAEVRAVARQGEEGERVRRRFLARQPKAALYVDFPDFGFVKLVMLRASLNGGFGKAYELTREDLCTAIDDATGLVAAEQSAITHMNGDHAEALSLYATRLAGEAPGPWRLTAIDPEGMDLMAGERAARIPFPERVASAEALHAMTIRLAREARMQG